MKTIYTNNISPFIPLNESILQNFDIKSADIPKVGPRTVINYQRVYSIISQFEKQPLIKFFH